METENNTRRRGLLGRLYGGIDMTWVKVALLAVATAAATSLFLILPVFRNSSLERMGVHLEAWIFFAVIIMANCKKPLESALKTFMFFLISQPLIYLIQVPFSWRGWGLFSYYRTWFIATLLTLPMAFVGWYITRRDWLSVLILSPALAFLAFTGFDCACQCAAAFPRLLLATLFCLAQIVLYIAAFFPAVPQKLVGALVVAAVVAVLLLRGGAAVDVDGTTFLPGDPVLTDAAVVEMDEAAPCEVTIAATGADSMVRVKSKALGSTDFTIRDGDEEYRYALEIYIDNGGHTQIRIEESD